MGFKVSRLLSAECTFIDNDGTECKTEHFFRGKEFDAECVAYLQDTQSRLSGVSVAKLKRLERARVGDSPFENVDMSLLEDLTLGEITDGKDQERMINIYNRTIESAKGYETDDGSDFSPIDHVPPSHKQAIVKILSESRNKQPSKNSPKASGE